MIRIPEELARKGNLAMARRLGVDPGQVTSAGFTVTAEGGEAEARVEWTSVAYLPTQEAFDLLMNPPRD